MKVVVAQNITPGSNNYVVDVFTFQKSLKSWVSQMEACGTVQIEDRQFIERPITWILKAGCGPSDRDKTLYVTYKEDKIETKYMLTIHSEFK